MSLWRHQAQSIPHQKRSMLILGFQKLAVEGSSPSSLLLNQCEASTEMQAISCRLFTPVLWGSFRPWNTKQMGIWVLTPLVEISASALGLPYSSIYCPTQLGASATTDRSASSSHSRVSFRTASFNPACSLFSIWIRRNQRFSWVR